MSDLPRDEHLRAALRHAPDAGLSAPPDISAQILAAAHRAASEPQPAAAKPRSRWWAPKTPWSLGASGAFATLLLAGVIGMIWRGETPGPDTEAASELRAARSADPPAPAAAPMPAPASAARVDAPPPKEPPKRDEAARQREAPAMVLQRAQKQEADRDEARRSVLLKESAAPPPPAPAAVPAAAPMLAQAPVAAAEKPMADTANAGVLGRAAPAATSSALRAAPRPEAPWMAALAAGPEVQWTVDGESRAPTSSWLYALAAQTQGRWRPAPDAKPDPADARVQWQQGEQLLGRLWLGAERVLWCDPQNRCEQAALAPDVASALRKGLAR